MTKEELEQCGCWFTDTGECVKDDIDLKKFAKLIAKKEREECAKLMESQLIWASPAQTIRARGQE